MIGYADDLLDWDYGDCQDDRCANCGNKLNGDNKCSHCGFEND